MLLNYARAFNSGVPVQLVYDATGSITDVAVQLIGFSFTSFHAHMNPACLGFIPSEMESEESYTTVWTAYRKSLHALIYNMKPCCIHYEIMNGEDGPNHRLSGLTMSTQWYDQLTGLFNTGKDTPVHILKAKNDQCHQKFMTLKEKAILEDKHLEYNLDIMQSFVILTALPQEWNKETKHTSCPDLYPVLGLAQRLGENQP